MDENEIEKEEKAKKHTNRALNIATYVFIEVMAGYYARMRHGPISSLPDCFDVLFDLLAYSLVGVIMYVIVYMIVYWVLPKPGSKHENIHFGIFLIPVPVIAFVMTIFDLYL